MQSDKARRRRQWLYSLVFFLILSLSGLLGCDGNSSDDAEESGTENQPDDENGADDDSDDDDDNDAAGDDDDDNDDNDDDDSLRILDLKATANPSNNLSAYVTFRTNAPTTARLDIAGPGAHAWSLGPTQVPADAYAIPVLGMYDESEYAFTLTVWDQTGDSAQSDPLSFATGALPADLPPIQVVTTDPARTQSGIVLFNIYRWEPKLDIFYGLILGVDNTGRIVWYKKRPYFQGNFTYLSSGNLMHSVWLFFAVEADFMGDIYNTWSVFSLHTYSMHHDLFELPWGEYPTFGSEVRQISGYPDKATYNVVGDRIAWFDNDGNLIKEWNLFDYLDPLRTQEGFEDDTFWGVPYFYVDSPKDWTHGNGFLYDESDNSIIVSLRNQSWLVKIDMDTDEMVWKLGWEGDFTMLPGGYWQWHQHSPVRMDNGHLLIYDNGNGRWLPPEIPRFTRIVEFAVDEQNMTVEQVWQYLGDQIYYSPFLGDVSQLSNGNILICDGGLQTDPYDPYDTRWWKRIRIKEITYEANPETVFEIYIDDPFVEYSAYNGIRIEDFYTRIYPAVSPAEKTGRSR